MGENKLIQNKKRCKQIVICCEENESQTASNMKSISMQFVYLICLTAFSDGAWISEGYLRRNGDFQNANFQVSAKSVKMGSKKERKNEREKKRIFDRVVTHV